MADVLTLSEKVYASAPHRYTEQRNTSVTQQPQNNGTSLRTVAIVALVLLVVLFVVPHVLHLLGNLLVLVVIVAAGVVGYRLLRSKSN